MADTKQYAFREKRGLINGIGSIWKSITGNLDSSDGEYFNECTNKITRDEYQIENLLKNQISVTTSVIKSFNATIQKLQIDEETFNNDIKEIRESIMDISDQLKFYQSQIDMLNFCELLMESYSFIKDSLNDIVNAITFARLKILHSSIITPFDLIESLRHISQSLQKNNLPLSIYTSNLPQYLDIIELQAYQLDTRIVFVLNIPLTDAEQYTLYRLYPIPIMDNRTGLHSILTTTHKYIARNDDSLLYLTINSLESCKTLRARTKICYNILPYPIDSDAVCEAQLLKRQERLPRTCQTSVVFAKDYNVQKISMNLWLITVSDPLPITIKCESREVKSEIINTNHVPNYNPHKIHLPDLKPLKLSKINTENLEIAHHKLNQYSEELDKLINEPFVNKHISWFTILTIIVIVTLVVLYILCKCRSKRRFKIGIANTNDNDHPPSPPRHPETAFARNCKKILPRRRPSIHLSDSIDEEERIQLNTNKQTV
ncbi:uncharacterized protein LOC126893054 [Diabrotica virgifera virgifera]|uniref:Envelope fusion protein n=1 Tax=Diabrotica virgifera virgifera TaxID=50390 RepID=A0ABM5L933_DIAVI|nr:uncharacterized protein LOC126893054 [Diabrotica virgifera virgifera]